MTEKRKSEMGNGLFAVERERERESCVKQHTCHTEEKDQREFCCLKTSVFGFFDKEEEKVRQTLY